MLSTYRSLDAERVVETAGVLRDRIKERFPESGLSNVASELCEVARESIKRSARVNHPIVWVRIAVGLLVTLMVSAVVAGFCQLHLRVDVSGVGSFLQALEAGMNTIVLVGAAIFFLVTLESRIKRRMVLEAVHELRSLSHIIDAHQLAKNPEWFLHLSPDRPSSPRRTMTAFELSRYLIYCTELLSLIGKIAALHVQGFQDSVTLEAVDDIEDLSTGLSRKIWQKIGMLTNKLGPEA